MTSFLSRVFGVLMLAGLATAAWAAEPPIIAKARAYLGSEETLKGITSVRYLGTLTAPDPKDPTKQVQAKMDIIFQKPERQRITASADTHEEITALDGYEGWRSIRNPKEPEQRARLNLLTNEQVKRLRANTWENLAFFRNIEGVGGKLEDLGTVTIDGVTCQKLAYIHGPNIKFTRYFDTNTGRLIFTETETGGTIREAGEIMVNGMRFPKTLITSTKNPKDGSSQTVTIEFDKIEVNQPYADVLFRVPMPTR